jgi:hypothetical protein
MNQWPKPPLLQSTAQNMSNLTLFLPPRRALWCRLPTTIYQRRARAHHQERRSRLIDNSLTRRIHLVCSYCRVSCWSTLTTRLPRVVASHTSPFIRPILPLCHPYRQILQLLVIPIPVSTNIDYSQMEGGALQLTTGPPAAQLWFQDLNPQLEEFLSRPHPAISA